MVYPKYAGDPSCQEPALTFSAPLLATIFILFGIGYTIDYNSTFLLSSERFP